MHYSPPAVNFAGYLVLGFSVAWSGGVWLVSQAVELTPSAAQAATQAGSGAVWIGVASIVTILVNGWLADRKSRREDARLALDSESRAEARLSKALREAEVAYEARLARSLHEAESAYEEKVAAAKQESDSKIAAAAELADARVATLEARLALSEAEAKAVRIRRHDQIADLDAQLNGLRVHSDQNRQAVNALIPAVVEAAGRVGVMPPDVAPVPSPFEDLTTTPPAPPVTPGGAQPREDRPCP